MEKETPQHDSLGEDLRTYANLQFRLMELKVVERASSAGSAAGERLVLALALLFAMLFLSGALGFFLGQRLSSYALGFGLVGAGCLLIFLLLFTFRRRLLREPLRNTIIDNLLEKEN